MKKKDFDRYMDRKKKKTPRDIILFLLGSSYHKDCKTCNQRVDQALVEIDAIHTSEKRKIASSYFNDGLEAGKKMAEKEFKSKVPKKKRVIVEEI